jgi:hypothetical protein
VCPLPGKTLYQACAGEKRRARGFCIVCDVSGAVGPRTGPEVSGVRDRGRGGGDAVARGAEGGLSAAAEVQPGEDVPDLGAHGGLPKGQRVGYLQDAVSLGHEAEDLNLRSIASRTTWARRGAGTRQNLRPASSA